MKGTDSIITFEQFQAIIKQMLEISYPDKEVKINKVEKASDKNYMGLTITSKLEKKPAGEETKADDFTIAPTHNLDRYYEVYKADRTVTFRDIVNDIISEQKRNEPDNYGDELEFHKKMTDINFLKYQVIFELMNEKTFQFLEDVPHRRLDDTDIVIIYKVLVPDKIMKLINKNFTPNSGIATTLITSKTLGKIGEMNKTSISEQDLFNWSMKNTPELLKMQLRTTDTDILNFIIEHLGDGDKLDDLMDKTDSFIKVLDNEEWFKKAMQKTGRCVTDPFYAILSPTMLKYMDSKSDTITFQYNYRFRMELIKLINDSMNLITNERIVHGAGVLLYENKLIPRLLCKLFTKSRIYFAPSSVHEVILMDSELESTEGLDYLYDTINEVNSNLSDKSDLLSDKILAYDYRTNTFRSIGRSCEKSDDDPVAKVTDFILKGVQATVNEMFNEDNSSENE